MKRNIITAFIFLAMASVTQAQKKISFSTQSYAGLATGESGTEPLLQTVNGIKWNSWFAGAGTGIDWYYMRSIPVYVSVSRDILKKNRRDIFVNTDVGINFPWIDYSEKGIYSYGDSKQESGLYWGAGIGFKFGVGKNDNKVLMHLGYSFKKLGERVTYVNPCLWGPCPESTEKYDYYLKRVSFKLGWGF